MSMKFNETILDPLWKEYTAELSKYENSIEKFNIVIDRFFKNIKTLHTLYDEGTSIEGLDEYIKFAGSEEAFKDKLSSIKDTVVKYMRIIIEWIKKMISFIMNVDQQIDDLIERINTRKIFIHDDQSFTVISFDDLVELKKYAPNILITVPKVDSMNEEDRYYHISYISSNQSTRLSISHIANRIDLVSNVRFEGTGHAIQFLYYLKALKSTIDEFKQMYKTLLKDASNMQTTALNNVKTAKQVDQVNELFKKIPGDLAALNSINTKLLKSCRNIMNNVKYDYAK